MFRIAKQRYEMGKQGMWHVGQFAPERIWNQWENLLLETVEQYRHRYSIS